MTYYYLFLKSVNYSQQGIFLNGSCRRNFNDLLHFLILKIFSNTCNLWLTSTLILYITTHLICSILISFEMLKKNVSSRTKIIKNVFLLFKVLWRLHLLTIRMITSVESDIIYRLLQWLMMKAIYQLIVENLVYVQLASSFFKILILNSSQL